MKAVWRSKLTVLCGFVFVCLQQRPLQWLNEELVNMREGRTLHFTSLTCPDALAQRKMERNGKSKKLNSYLVHNTFAPNCEINGINQFDGIFFLIHCSYFKSHHVQSQRPRDGTCQNI